MKSLPGSGSSIATALNSDHFWETAVKISEQRLTVLASNIANADTPNYKARDIDFRASLEQALAMSTGADTDLKVAKPKIKDAPFMATMLYRIPAQPAVDGNTIEMDAERAKFAEQTIRYEFILRQAIDEYKEIGSLFKSMT